MATGGRWIAVAAVVTALVLACPPHPGARAWGLEELRRVRVEVTAPEGVDPVDLEVEVLKRFQDLGIRSDPLAPALLRLEVRTAEASRSVGLELEEGVCLQRDPLRCAPAVTWAGAAVARGPEPLAVLLGQVLDRFEEAWRRANADRSVR